MPNCLPLVTRILMLTICLLIVVLVFSCKVFLYNQFLFVHPLILISKICHFYLKTIMHSSSFRLFQHSLVRRMVILIPQEFLRISFLQVFWILQDFHMDCMIWSLTSKVEIVAYSMLVIIESRHLSVLIELLGRLFLCSAFLFDLLISEPVQ